MREPVFTETLQVAIVVRDLEAACAATVSSKLGAATPIYARFVAEKGEGVHHLASRSSAPGASRSPWSGQVQ